MKFQTFSLVLCAVFAAAVAEVYFEEKFTEGKFFVSLEIRVYVMMVFFFSSFLYVLHYIRHIDNKKV